MKKRTEKPQKIPFVTNKKELEDLLFRRIGMFWIESYWEQSGEAGINAIERAIRILDALPPLEIEGAVRFYYRG